MNAAFTKTRRQGDKETRSRGFFLLLVSLSPCLLVSLSGYSMAQDSVPRPEVGIEQRLNESVPLDLVFRDETGKSATLREYFQDRPVVLVLAYYRCPRLCSMVLTGLTDGLRRIDYDIGKEFTVVTVSFDPREQPELAAAKKAAYLDHYGRPGAAAGWHFLTGDQEPIRRLADAVGFHYSFDEKTGQYAHASGIMILTADGRITRYLLGIDYSPRDLRFALEDASAGKIGSPVVRPLRLLCFGDDPATGGYALMSMRILRLVSAVTVLVLAVLIWRGWRRPRTHLAPRDEKASRGA